MIDIPKAAAEARTALYGTRITNQFPYSDLEDKVREDWQAFALAAIRASGVVEVLDSAARVMVEVAYVSDLPKAETEVTAIRAALC
jgi:hypothetical protein